MTVIGLGSAVFAFFAVYATKWVLENAMQIGAALGMLFALYVATTQVENIAVAVPLAVFIIVTGACVGFLFRTGFIFLGYLREERSWKATSYAGGRATYLFVIGTWGGGPIAFVRARDPQRRLKLLQVGTPRRLRVLAEFAFDSEAQALAAERLVRARLRPFRDRGDWFSADLKSVRRILSEADDAEGDETVLTRPAPPLRSGS